MENKLDRIYNSFIGLEDPLNFFRGLGEYLEYVNSVPSLKKAFDGQIETRNKLYRKIEKSETKIEQEITEAQQELLKIIEDNKVDTSQFKRYTTFPALNTTNIFDEFQDYLNGRFSINGYRSDTVQKFLFDLAINLKNLGYEDKVKHFLVSDEDYASYYNRIEPNVMVYKNEFGNFIFSKTRPERFETIALLENERILKPWGSFEKLKKFKKAYDCVLNNINFWGDLNAGKETPEFSLELEVRNVIDVCDMIEDLKLIVKNNTKNFSISQSGNNSRQIKELKVEQFRYSTQTVHRVLSGNIGENNSKEDYSSLTEEINLKTYGIKISGNKASKGSDKPKKVFNPSERKLLYFFYMKCRNSKDEYFKLKFISKEFGQPEGTIKNSMTAINKTIGELVSKEKKVRVQLFENSRDRGYRLNPKLI